MRIDEPRQECCAVEIDVFSVGTPQVLHLDGSSTGVSRYQMFLSGSFPLK